MTADDRGVLFDVDGTLVDTNYLHVVTWWQALRAEGFEVPMATVHRAIGMGSDRILDHLLGDRHDHTLDDRLRAAHTALYSTYWERLRPLPGAPDLLRACASRGVRVVLASSASAAEITVLRSALDVDDILDTVTNADDVAASKPAPDIFAAALRRSGLAAGRTVVVGDTVWDVHAASKLDIPCIGVTCGGVSEGELRDAGAVEVHSDPAALLATIDDSVLVR